MGKKVRLTFEAEVTSLRKPPEWQVNEGKKDKDEIIAEFKLLKGAFDFVSED